MKELENTINSIKLATQLDVSIYTSSGELIKSGAKNAITEIVVPNSEMFIDDCYLDYENSTTYFLIKKKGFFFVGTLDGASVVTRNYAIMVAKILENAFTKSIPLTQNDRVKLLLAGELNEENIAQLKSNFVDKQFDYYVLSLIVNEHKKLTELKNFLTAICNKEDFIIVIDSVTITYIKHCGLDEEYQSANDFAAVLYANIKEELRINLNIGVGGVIHSFDDLQKFYHYSVVAYSLGKLIDANNNIFSYKEYILLKLMQEVPIEVLSQYLSVLMDKNAIDIFDDEELMSTADVFAKNSLNVSETSRNMYMHRNTLIYRLDKIEKATGLNIRKFSDAVTFRLIVLLSKIINSNKI